MITNLRPVLPMNYNIVSSISYIQVVQLSYFHLTISCFKKTQTMIEPKENEFIIFLATKQSTVSNHMGTDLITECEFNLFIYIIQ